MNFNFIKRIKSTAVIIAILLLVFPLSGCGIIIINDMSENNPSNYEPEKNIYETETIYTPVEYTVYTPAEDTKAMSEKYLSELPERNFDGAVFFITTPNKDYIDPDSSSYISGKTAERNERIEEKYNISIITSLADAKTIFDDARVSIAADSYYTDLMMIPAYMTGQFRMNSLLMNLHSLPFFSTDEPYFNSDSAEMASGGYSTYGIAGDASINPASLSAMFFNRDIMKELGLDLPYSLAVSGKWTWDKFFEYTAAAANTDGERKIYTFGTQNNASRLADLIFNSCGNKYITAAEKAVPQISFTSESAQYAVDVAHRLITDANAVTDADNNAVTSFANGEMLFLAEYLYVMPWITNSPANWGVLPMPKESESGEYRTLVSNNELIFTVPANHKNGEMAAIVLSALNAGSYGYLYDEYVNHNMIHVLRDNDSINMLDMILDTASFDFALAFGNGYPTIAAGTYGLIRNAAVSGNLAEIYTEATETASKTLETYFDLRY